MISLSDYNQGNMAVGIIAVLFPLQFSAVLFSCETLRCPLLPYSRLVSLQANCFQTSLQKTRCLSFGGSILWQSAPRCIKRQLRLLGRIFLPALFPRLFLPGAHGHIRAANRYLRRFRQHKRGCFGGFFLAVRQTPPASPRIFQNR